MLKKTICALLAASMGTACGGESSETKQASGGAGGSGATASGGASAGGSAGASAGGSAATDAGQGKVGDPCSSAGQCPAGGSGAPVCLTDWPGGYCAVSSCEVHGHDCPNDPGLGGTATTGGKCVLAPEATCLALCASSADCRDGYECLPKPDAAGHATANVCVPAQTSSGGGGMGGGGSGGGGMGGGGSGGMGTGGGMGSGGGGMMDGGM